MRRRWRGAQRATVVVLGAHLLASVPARPAVASEADQAVSIEIGQPSVWSLAQAHYFLALMHRNNEKLQTLTPDATVLDPNAVNASRVQALQQLIGASVKFDQAAALKNRAGVQTYHDQIQRRDQARADLAVRRTDLDKARSEQEALDEQVAALTAQDQAADAARGKAPETPADVKRKSELATLTVRRDAKKAAADAIATDVSSLSTAASADVAAPAVTADTPSDVPTDFASSDAFKTFVNSAVGGMAAPKLSATIALDNFIGMQYEIIAKQLSLLRDEVGPDERVIFLELPASVYTVDKHGKNYLARVSWEVTSYYDTPPALDIQNEEICEQLTREAQDPRTILGALKPRRKRTIEQLLASLRPDAAPTPCVDRAIVEALKETMPPARAESESCAAQHNQAREELSREIDALVKVTPAGLVKEDAAGIRANLSRTLSAEVPAGKESAEQACAGARTGVRKPVVAAYRETIEDSGQDWPITLSMVQRQIDRCKANPAATADCCVTPADEDKGGQQPRPLHVRTLEIIPHQSAINVNASTAGSHGWFFHGLVGLLNGLGLDIVARSQRETYDKFLQQEVFATGFGKGGATFGWTFGPQPGTDRIAPGQRTTYAVLAVPRNTLAIALTASGRAFKQRESPDRRQDLVSQKFLIGVPGPQSEKFWVKGIAYAPVPKGGTVTALLLGSFFSPQLGVLVDGVPLQRALSITRVAGDDSVPAPGSSGVAGEFEITNSHEIALRFAMAKDYVGTPQITLVSPERSNGLNRFPLEVNYRPRRLSLAEASRSEPMFVDPLDAKLDVDRVDGPASCCEDRTLVRARLQGGGLRFKATVAINGHPLPVLDRPADLAAIEDSINTAPCEEFAVHESTRSLFLYFKDPGNHWTVRYTQPAAGGVETREIDKSFDKAPFAAEVRHFRSGRDGQPSKVFLRLTGDKDIAKVNLVEPERRSCSTPAAGEDGGLWVTCTFAAERARAPQDFITIAAADEKGKTLHLLDVDLPVSPRISRLINPRTGRPVGFGDEQPVIVIEGIALQGVTGVLFGDQAAALSSAAGFAALTVKLPKIDVAPGEAKELPVLLQLKDGTQVPGGASYRFLGAPLPEILLCGGLPCRPGQRGSRQP